MAGRHPKSMRPRDERAHPVVRDAIDRGHLGTGKPYVINGFTSHDAANEARKSVYCACRHLNVSCSSKEAEDIIPLTDGTFRLQFRIFSKDSGRQHVAATYGHDPASLPYNPFARAEGPLLDDSGGLA